MCPKERNLMIIAWMSKAYRKADSWLENPVTRKRSVQLVFWQTTIGQIICVSDFNDCLIMQTNKDVRRPGPFVSRLNSIKDGERNHRKQGWNKAIWKRQTRFWSNLFASSFIHNLFGTIYLEKRWHCFLSHVPFKAFGQVIWHYLRVAGRQRDQAITAGQDSVSHGFRFMVFYIPAGCFADTSRTIDIIKCRI